MPPTLPLSDEWNAYLEAWPAATRAAPPTARRQRELPSRQTAAPRPNNNAPRTNGAATGQRRWSATAALVVADFAILAFGFAAPPPQRPGRSGREASAASNTLATVRN
jgi:hypothetical protein